MRLRHTLYLLFFLTLIGKLSAQNLVPNPSFEETDLCKEQPRAPLAKDILPWYGSGRYHSFSLISKCSAIPQYSAPYNGWGHLSPRHGDNYIVLCVSKRRNEDDSDARSFLSVELSSPLKAGKRYFVQYHIGSVKNVGNSSLAAINHFGLFFSKDKPDTSENIYRPADLDIAGEPIGLFLDYYYDHWDNSMLYDTRIFQAKGGEKYLTLGCLDTIAKTSYKIIKQGANDTIECWYYLDSIGVSACPSIGSDTTVYCGDGLDLHISDLSKNSTYKWGDGSTDSILHVTKSGTYWIEIDSYSPWWWHFRDSITVNFVDLKDKPHIANGTICKGEAYNIHLPEQKDVSYTWWDGDTSKDKAIYMEGTYYLLTKYDSCTFIDSFRVSYYTGMDSIYLPDTTLCEGKRMNIDLRNFNGEATWQDGSQSKYYEISREGEYIVALKGQCETKTKSFKVSYAQCNCTVYVPNAFTPDGNDINDTLYAMTDCEVKDFSMTVYNRWGQRIFTSNNIKQGWNGKDATEGIYLYSINATLRERGTIRKLSQKGSVQLMR